MSSVTIGSCFFFDRMTQPEFQFSDYGEDMSVDFAQSSDHSYLGYLNDCGVPRSHVMNQGRDDRDLEHELESL